MLERGGRSHRRQGVPDVCAGEMRWHGEPRGRRSDLPPRPSQRCFETEGVLGRSRQDTRRRASSRYPSCGPALGREVGACRRSVSEARSGRAHGTGAQCASITGLERPSNDGKNDRFSNRGRDRRSNRGFLQGSTRRGVRVGPAWRVRSDGGSQLGHRSCRRCGSVRSATRLGDDSASFRRASRQALPPARCKPRRGGEHDQAGRPGALSLDVSRRSRTLRSRCSS